MKKNFPFFEKSLLYSNEREKTVQFFERNFLTTKFAFYFEFGMNL